MRARSFFVMIVILEPDQPRASGPAGRLLLRSISYSSRSRLSPSLRSIRDFNSPFAGAIYASEKRIPVAIRYARRAEIARPFVHAGGLACNEQNHSDCACHVNYTRETRGSQSQFAEKFPRLVALSRCSNTFPSGGARTTLARLNYKSEL